MATTILAPRHTQQTATPAQVRDGFWTHVLATDQSWPLLMLRLTLAVVIFPHGAQKLLGWFGGFGFTGTMGYFTESVGIPYVLGVLVMIAEFFGSIALVIGFAGRIAALGIAAVMVGAVVTTHLPNGFFMNWTGTQAGEGFEYHILALGMCLAILIGGSGALSVDRLVTRRS